LILNKLLETVLRIKKRKKKIPRLKTKWDSVNIQCSFKFLHH